MKRHLVVLLLFCLLAPVSHAQIWKRKRYEFTFGLGPSQFFGDVGGYSNGKNFLGLRDLSFSQSRYNLNVDLRYRVTQLFSTRLSLTYANLHASDARGSNIDRDYDAVTTIFEPALLGEYYFVKHKRERSFLLVWRGQGTFGDVLRAFDFYAFSGIGGLYYNVNPNATLKAKGGDLSGFTGVVPLGLGGSFIYTPNINFGVELGGRYALSDKIDGYTSQYSRFNDVYYFLNFTITYKLKVGPRGLPSFR